MWSDNRSAQCILKIIKRKRSAAQEYWFSRWIQIRLVLLNNHCDLCILEIQTKQKLLDLLFFSFLQNSRLWYVVYNINKFSNFIGSAFVIDGFRFWAYNSSFFCVFCNGVACVHFEYTIYVGIWQFFLCGVREWP